MSVSSNISSHSSYAGLTYLSNSEGLSVTVNNRNSRSGRPISQTLASQPSPSRTSLPQRESCTHTQRGRWPQKKAQIFGLCRDDVTATATATFVPFDSHTQQPQHQPSVSARDSDTVTPDARVSYFLRTNEDGHKIAICTPLVCKVLDALEKNINKELFEFSGVSSQEYLALTLMIEERSSKLLRTPKLTYIFDHQSLIIQMPSDIHQVPVIELNPVLAQFQQTDYPRSLVRLQVAGNLQLEGRSISAVPDLSVVLSTLKKPRIRQIPFILESAFSQSSTSVFKKVKELVNACPDALVVIVVLIDEATPYRSPSEDSSAWARFIQDADPLISHDFFAEAEPQPEHAVVTDAFTDPVVVAGHTWSSIKCVNYYVWLKNPAIDGAIAIDPEAIEQTEWSAHGVLPGTEADMDHVKAVMNRGLDLIRSHFIQFCGDAAARSGKEADLASLKTRIVLPYSWDHFRLAFDEAKHTTAYDRYVRWYKATFRGKKRSHSTESFVPSDTPSQDL